MHESWSQLASFSDPQLFNVAVFLPASWEAQCSGKYNFDNHSLHIQATKVPTDHFILAHESKVYYITAGILVQRERWLQRYTPAFSSASCFSNTKDQSEGT